MRAVILFFLFPVILYSKDGSFFRIEGSIDPSVKCTEWVYLSKSNPSFTTVETVDSTLLNNGRFIFQGIVFEPEMYSITLFPYNNSEYAHSVIVEPGNINISIVSDSYRKIGGTPLNDEMNRLNVIQKKFNKELLHYYVKESLTKEEIQKYKSILGEINTSSFNFIKQNINNKVGLREFIYSKNLNYDQQIELLEYLNVEDKSIKKIQDKIAIIQLEKNVKVGTKFSDVKGFSPDGNVVSLSDYVGKGKIVLLDFWASWCGTCLDDATKLKDAYEKFKDKGFEVIGISLDDNKDRWTNAIEKHNLSWIHISDLKGWKSEALAVYPATPIPFTVLIDAEGYILETHLKGNMLSVTLEKILDN